MALACEICAHKSLAVGSYIALFRYKRCQPCENVMKRAYAAISQALTFSGGRMTQEQETWCYQEMSRVRLPLFMANPLVAQIQRCRMLTKIQDGELPRVAVNIHLESDEVAHMDMRASCMKPSRKRSEYIVISGHFVATNKKLYFLSVGQNQSREMNWGNITNVTVHAGNQVVISTSKGPGAGTYTVQDAEYAKEIIDTEVRLWNRQLVVQKSASRHIPQHIVAEVFRLDGGKCRECGATDYLEVDHIIPFSRGGASTVNNLQLLCRKCNLRKSNRI